MGMSIGLYKKFISRFSEESREIFVIIPEDLIILYQEFYIFFRKFQGLLIPYLTLSCILYYDLILLYLLIAFAIVLIPSVFLL